MILNMFSADIHILFIIISEFLLSLLCNAIYYENTNLNSQNQNIHLSNRQKNNNPQIINYGLSNRQQQTQDTGLATGPSINNHDFVTATDGNHQNNIPRTFSSNTHSILTNITQPIILSKEDAIREEMRSRSSMRDQIVNLIMSKYRSYERPPDGGNATIVTVNMKVLEIFSIDVRTMDYYIDMYLRQTWKDRRLSWEEIPEFRTFTQPLVSPKLKEQLWLPDLFFRNGKDGYLHKLTLPNYLLRVHPDGSVLYSQKITMRFSCQMHLQTFPMDTQRCHMNIGSYGYTSNELKFVWNEVMPVVSSDKLQLPEFKTPVSFDASDCSMQYATSTGQYPCLNATFELQRQLGPYLATTYIPNGLIIMVSWLSFWVNVDSVSARVLLGLLSLLGILTQAISVSSTLPRVSYIKAIDIWMIFSIIFVIGVLVEYAVALTLLRRKQSETWHEDVKDIVREELARWCAISQQQQSQQLQSSQGPQRGQFGFREELETLLTTKLIDQNKDKAHARRPSGLVESKIDKYSRFLFPVFFLLYNCFYWCYFLVIVKQA